MRSLVLILALILSASTLASTGQRASERMPEGAYFRHYSADGVMHLNRTLTSDAIRSGYQLLDEQGRILEDVKAVNLNDEEARVKRLQQARQARQDEELLRMYAGPEDAVRARDRKIDALDLSISYEENSLAQLQMKLDDEIAVAARNERAGREVPEGVLEAIERLKRQIELAEEKLEAFEADIEEARKEYAPIIQRLEQIEKAER
ncbi:MAG: hypothetical protein JKY21_08355 [Alcanivorax sp.]|nr:hypothetical protein [Alcanivorax sp.]